MTSPLDLNDVQQKIKSDFEDQSSHAIIMLKDAIGKTKYLNEPRIIRCIVFLSNGDIKSLNKNIDVAIYDPRDVMLWAEYTKLDAENRKRVRNFNKPFK